MLRATEFAAAARHTGPTHTYVDADSDPSAAVPFRWPSGDDCADLIRPIATRPASHAAVGRAIRR